jgi:serine protease inhibitor
MSMTRRFAAACRCALVLILVAGCTVGSPSPTGPPVGAPSTAPATAGPAGQAISAVARVAANPEDAGLAGNAINAFGIELLLRATADGENSVLSPASIVLALGMARPGARGDTAVEMDRVLREAASDDHASWLNALDAALATRNGTFPNRFNKPSDVTLKIVNTSFAQQDYAWDPTYLDALASRFGSGVNLVDYSNAPEPARLAINEWVDERTERRIPELLPEGSIDSLTRLVLVNAIYMKAAWQTQFMVEATTDAPFTTLGGERISVPTMHQTTSVPYAAGDGWRAVELPYAGESLAMLVIVPDDLVDFQESLDGTAFSRIAADLEERRIELALPKFGLETKINLIDALAELGMPLAFDPNRADFSGMTEAEALYISAVIHQANLDLDEEGTEAAAATGVVIGTTSAPLPPLAFKVDRPFLFALRDRPTGAILFLGRVVEPEIRGA